MSFFPAQLHTLVSVRPEKGAVRLMARDDQQRTFTVAFLRGQEMLQMARILSSEPRLIVRPAPRLGEALLHVHKERTPQWEWMTESVPTGDLFAETKTLVLPYKVLLETSDVMVFQSRIYI